MVAIEGGTQALRRTVNASLDIEGGSSTAVSVPSPLGATVLKAAAYMHDSRDRQRHLYDAAALLACIEDPFADADQLRGSDRRRLRLLADHLPDGHPAWALLDQRSRLNGQAALRILNSG